MCHIAKILRVPTGLKNKEFDKNALNWIFFKIYWDWDKKIYYEVLRGWKSQKFFYINGCRFSL